MRNRRPDLNGIVVVDKPIGWSSAKVCAIIRKLTGGAKVGHAGTLDPLASGVLVVALGRATKSISVIQAMPKCYRTTIDLSAFTETDDAEGEPVAVHIDEPPSQETIESRIVSSFSGEIMQRPPAFSAVKIEGERAYRRARSGEAQVADRIKPKPITIHSIDIIRYEFPTLELDIECSKGTYIRSIAKDLGSSLGTGGFLASLARTAVGQYTIDRAFAPEQAGERAAEGKLLEPPASQA